MTPQEDDEAAQREHEWLNHVWRDGLLAAAWYLLAAVCVTLLLAHLWLTLFGG